MMERGDGREGKGARRGRVRKEGRREAKCEGRRREEIEAMGVL